MFEIVLSSFSLVAISEMGDKTQLLAFSLAARFKQPRAIMLGILAATLLNHTLASAFGHWIAAQINPFYLSVVLSITFLLFGLWTLKPDTFEERTSPDRYGPFLTTLILFFLAEMGDKTQLATVALAAKYDSIFEVTLGTTLGMLFTDGLAVFLGERLTQKISLRWIRVGAAVLFFAFGLSTLLITLGYAGGIETGMSALLFR
jgi:putative Ca2+/H+ antiporter (TMEM165/GDT1 family)